MNKVMVLCVSVLASAQVSARKSWFGTDDTSTNAQGQVFVDAQEYEAIVAGRTASICELFKQAVARETDGKYKAGCHSDNKAGFQVTLKSELFRSSHVVRILGLRYFVASLDLSHDKKDYSNISLLTYQKAIDAPVTGLDPASFMWTEQDALALLCAGQGEFNKDAVRAHMRTWGVSNEQMVRTLLKTEQRIMGLAHQLPWMKERKYGVPQTLERYRKLISELIG